MLNGLLTGGILIGKIAQGIAGAAGRSFVDPKTGFRISIGAQAGGVTFYQSDVSGKELVYAYNMDVSSPATVVVPNANSANGASYYIGPTQKLPFPEAQSPRVPPQTQVTCGRTEDLPSRSVGVDALPPRKPNYLKLAFENLRIGNVVNIGSFKMRCTTTQLIIIATGVSLGIMNYFLLRSSSGTSASNLNRILPLIEEPNTGPTEEKSFVYPVDFSTLGIDVNIDSLGGFVSVDVEGDELAKLIAMSPVRSEPLHEVERAYFKSIGLLA